MKTIGIISLSNSLGSKGRELIKICSEKLNNYGIKLYESDAVFKDDETNLSPSFRASEFMKLYKDKNIDMIFDVSGGDLANEVLPYIDFDIIKKYKKPYFGFSDLSVITNAIYKKTNIESYWFQLRSIANDSSDTSLKLLANFILKDDPSLFDFKYKYLQGNGMCGTIIGGNLRCTLKLAGTLYMPDFKDKILLIESLGGDINKITTYLTQYKLMGAFEKCSGVILGTFTELEKSLKEKEVEDLILNIIDNKNLPVIKTWEIGHHCLSKSIAIGKFYEFK